MFTRLRRQVNWVFIAIAVILAVGFVILGIRN
jgi:hypothetical protein